MAVFDFNFRILSALRARGIGCRCRFRRFGLGCLLAFGLRLRPGLGRNPFERIFGWRQAVSLESDRSAARGDPALKKLLRRLSSGLRMLVLPLLMLLGVRLGEGAGLLQKKKREKKKEASRSEGGR